MAISLPNPDAVGLVTPQADRPITSYRGGIAQQAQEQVGEGISRAGQGIAHAGAEIADAQDQVNMAASYGQFLQKKLTIDQQFEADQDYSTSPQRYSEALQQAATDSSVGIQSTPMRAQFQDRVARMQEFAINTQLSRAHAKSVDADRGFLSDQLNKTVDAAAQATDDATRQQLYGSYGQLIAGMVAKGSITQQEGIRIGEQARNQAAYRYFKTSADTDPTLTTKLLLPGGSMLAGGMNTDTAAAIHKAAYTHGADEEVLARTAQIEDGNGAVGNGGGTFQFSGPTRSAYGVTKPSDVNQNADAAARLQTDNSAALGKSLGRAPSGPELYLAHQQGATGAATLIQNPDMSAVDALTPVYGDRAQATKAIVNNGGTVGMKAGDFVNQWADKYNATPGHAPGGTPQPTQDANGNVMFPKTGDMRDWLRPDQRADLLHMSEQRAEALARAQEVDDGRQQRIQEKALRDGSNDAENRIIADATGTGDNPNITAAQIADPKGKYNQLLPEAKLRMIGFLDRNAKASDKDAAQYGPGFDALFHQIHAGPDDPGRITDPSTLYDKTGPGKELTVAGLKQLQSEMESNKTPEGAAEGQMKKGFFDAAHVDISMHGFGLNGKDPIGEQKFAQFQIAALSAYDAGRKAGKTPQQLLSENSPDYVGKMISQFTRTNAQKMADFFSANNPDVDQASGTKNTPAATPAAPAFSQQDLHAEMVRRGLLKPSQPAGPTGPQAAH